MSFSASMAFKSSKRSSDWTLGRATGAMPCGEAARWGSDASSGTSTSLSSNTKGRGAAAAARRRSAALPKAWTAGIIEVATEEMEEAERRPMFGSMKSCSVPGSSKSARRSPSPRPGTTAPVAIRIAAPGPLVNPVTPTVAITNIDGALTPADPQGFLGEIDMIVAAPGSIQMDLETSSVPSGTDVEVTVKPKVGADPIVERVTLSAGNCVSGVCQASVLVDLDPGAYIVEARATFEAP